MKLLISSELAPGFGRPRGIPLPIIQALSGFEEVADDTLVLQDGMQREPLLRRRGLGWSHCDMPLDQALELDRDLMEQWQKRSMERLHRLKQRTPADDDHQKHKLDQRIGPTDWVEDPSSWEHQKSRFLRTAEYRLLKRCERPSSGIFPKPFRRHCLDADTFPLPPSAGMCLNLDV